jgi:hypothetical protein
LTKLQNYGNKKWLRRRKAEKRLESREESHREFVADRILRRFEAMSGLVDSRMRIPSRGGTP